MKSKFLKACAAFFTMYLMSISAAQAATVNIVTVADNPQETAHGIRASTSTYGSDLAGALVAATYSDGSSEALTWEALSIGVRGAARGADIDLFMDWAGFEMTTTRLLTSLSFQLAPASSIFDVSRLNEWEVGNTPTTGIGFPFEIYAGGDLLQGAITATYSGIVNLAGRVADGDAFTNMLIDFSGLSGGGFLGSMSFRTDMDTLAVAGDLTPVPLPAGLPLLLAGLGGFGMIYRRRKTA